MMNKQFHNFHLKLFTQLHLDESVVSSITK